MTNLKNYGSTYWRSLEALEGEATAESFAQREFQEGASELELDGVSRRRFVGILGASAALAGVTSTTGCVRKPEENIMPFAQRPEDLVPGEPVFYASAVALGGAVQGILVESQDGRPTKIEGNPKHSGSQGATDVFVQASILDLYDPERSTTAFQGDAQASWDQARQALEAMMDEVQAKQGAGLALVLDSVVSPTLRGQLQALQSRLPQVRLFVDDVGAPANAQAAAAMVAGQGTGVRYSLEGAGVILAADCDFLGVEGESTRLSREWSRGRRVIQPGDAMSRMYVVEPHLTGTGTMADHRRALRGADVGPLLVALARTLFEKHGVRPPSGAQGVVDGLPQRKFDAETQRFIEVLAKDLAANRGSSVVMTGHRQPAWVHGVGYLINAALDNVGRGLQWSAPADGLAFGPLGALAQALQDGSVDKVICLGTNPVYDAPAALGLKDALAKATLVHAGLYRDETGKVAAWHLPVSHYLEAWGDLEASDGTISIVQPLIAPLHHTHSILEMVAFLATGNWVDGYSVVKGHWMTTLAGRFSDRTWQRWLHDGLVTGVPRSGELPATSGWSKLGPAAAQEAEALGAEGIEIDFHLDPKVYDGRFANNAWMQELPHPITKLVWDNAAYLNPRTAERLGVENGQMLSITVDGRSASVPAWIAPGQADDTISLTLGYGRLGAAATGAGFDVNPLRPSEDRWIATGQVQAGGEHYRLVSTQDHGTMTPPDRAWFSFPERPIAQEATLSEFTDNPDFVHEKNLMPKNRLTHLWDPPELTGAQQWGMTVDLGTCTGCNACVTACQAENNIPVVGKEQVGNGREMHWMRIDRYYRGDIHEPTAIVQPMLCQHCEAAPCETVCPVNATSHSPEGLNDMAYNRCIGTRYCSNNCPYKVRRFNFFNYNLEIDPLLKMQKNPDVTVRFRGVMEKCTYCVQRIQVAKIDAHVAGKEVVADGVIQTACQQVCPTEAIVFGDVADPNSRVSQLKRQKRNYAVLSDLNTHPRTTYLARILNPHPELS